MTCCTDRATWTGVTPGTSAPVLGAFAGIGVVVNRCDVMRKPAASDSLR